MGHDYVINRVPADIFSTIFPGAAEVAEMLGYFQAHTYLGAKVDHSIALARIVSGARPTNVARWARSHMPVAAVPATMGYCCVHRVGSGIPVRQA